MAVFGKTSTSTFSHDNLRHMCKYNVRIYFNTHGNKDPPSRTICTVGDQIKVKKKNRILSTLLSYASHSNLERERTERGRKKFSHIASSAH